MRFAIRISKGITLSLLLSYSVVKEPTSAKGRQSCQTLTSVSSGLVPSSVNPTRLMQTRLPTRFASWKRSAGRVLPPLAGTGDSTFRPPPCQLASNVLNSATSLAIPRRGDATPRLSCCTTCCAESSYLSFSNDPVPFRDQPQRPCPRSYSIDFGIVAAGRRLG